MIQTNEVSACRQSQIRDILKKIADKWECYLDGNRFYVQYKEAYIDLTDEELQVFQKSQSNNTTDEELRPILKKLLEIMYLNRIGSYCTMFVLTDKMRKGRPCMRAAIGMGLCGVDLLQLTKAEYAFLSKLMRAEK